MFSRLMPTGSVGRESFNDQALALPAPRCFRLISLTSSSPSLSNDSTFQCSSHQTPVKDQLSDPRHDERVRSVSDISRTAASPESVWSETVRTSEKSRSVGLLAFLWASVTFLTVECGRIVWIFLGMSYVEKSCRSSWTI